MHLQRLAYRLDGEKGLQNMGKRKYHISFRCFFPDGRTQHHQTMTLSDIPKWLEAYTFTHPNVQSISVRFWPQDEEEG